MKTKGKASEVDINLGKNLKAIRLSNNLTQQQLADASDITFQQIQKYELGRNRISASRLLQFSEILGVDIKSFYDGLLDPNAKNEIFSQLDPDAKALALMLHQSGDKELIKAVKNMAKTFLKQN